MEHIGGHRAINDERYSNFSLGDLFSTKAGQDKTRAEAQKILSDAQLQNAIALSLNQPKTNNSGKTLMTVGIALTVVTLLGVAAYTIFKK